MRISLFFFEIEDNGILESEMNQYMHYLSHEKQNQIESFLFDIDKKLSLLSDLFVRSIACKVLNLKNNDLVFSKDKYGNPSLQGFPKFQYNVSHTKNAIVVGFSNYPLGVDIEKILKSEQLVAERSFCPNEIRYMQSHPDKQDNLFYKIWTQKEAYLKYIGKGITVPMKSIDVTSNELIKLLKTVEIEDYILTLCTRENFCKNDLYQLNEKQVMTVCTNFLNII